MSSNYYNRSKRPTQQSLSYSQQKRKQLDYRKEYFKHNPGYLGCIWKCAYCGKLLIGKGNVEVDHIMPLDNPLGQNARYNLVSACRECNRNKSCKLDGRVAIGYTSKIFDSIFYGVQKVVIIVVVGCWNCICSIAKSVGAILLSPIKNGSFLTKCVVIALYCLAAWVMFRYLLNGGF